LFKPSGVISQSFTLRLSHDLSVNQGFGCSERSGFGPTPFHSWSLKKTSIL
jgi:hypothetical protein